MNPEKTLPLECQRSWEAHEAGEPHVVAAHVRTCALCSDEMEARNQMNRRLRLAHEGMVAPPGLETRIRAAIRDGEAPGKALRPWLPRPAWAMIAAAVLMIAGSSGIAYQLGHLRLTRSSQDSYIAMVSNRLASILRPGVKDHIHCAFYRNYPKTPPSVEHFVRELGPEYRDLVQVVGRQVPAGYQMVLGHKCHYQGRRYIHLAIKGEGRLLSLVIAAKGDGESFVTENLKPSLAANGTSFYQASVQQFAVSAFETDRHLVYTVSDLPADQNMKVMVAMAPEVREVLGRAL